MFIPETAVDSRVKSCYVIPSLINIANDISFVTSLTSTIIGELVMVMTTSVLYYITNLFGIQGVRC